MIVTILSALLPILVALLLGFFAGWRRHFTQDQADAFFRMIMLYALPMLLFAGILNTPFSEIVSSTELFSWLAIGMIGGFLLVLLLSRFLFQSSIQLAALRALIIAGPAIPFVGTPVLDMLYPLDVAIAVSTGSLLYNVVQVPLTLVFLSTGSVTAGSKNTNAFSLILKSVVKAVQQPIVWAPILALILVIFGVKIPTYLESSFNLLGSISGGGALFAVGIKLYSQKISFSRAILVNVFAKMIILPALVMALMVAYGVSHLQVGIATITLALPAAALPVIFAVQHKIGEQEMGSSLFWNNIICLPTIGLFIWLMSV